MNNQKDNLNPSGNPQEDMIGRRELLKALAATSGAVVAASMLPGKWSEPVIEAGVLPAHAQGTPAPTDTVVIRQLEDDYVMRIGDPNSGPDYRSGEAFRDRVNQNEDFDFDVYIAYDGPDPAPTNPPPRPSVEWYLESDENDKMRLPQGAFPNDQFRYPNFNIVGTVRGRA